MAYFAKEDRTVFLPTFPVNPHRYFKDLATKIETPLPVGEINTCGYTVEPPTTEESCYYKKYVVNEKITVVVRICVLKDGSLRTTHEVTSSEPLSQKHGVQIINSIDGNTVLKGITNDFMIQIESPQTGTGYKTLSKLFPKYNYLTKTQHDNKFMTNSEIVAGIAGSGTIPVALYWIWRAIAFFRDKKYGTKKYVIFRCPDRTPAINAMLNNVTVERDGLFTNFTFTLMRGEKGATTICNR